MITRPRLAAPRPRARRRRRVELLAAKMKIRRVKNNVKDAPKERRRPHATRAANEKRARTATRSLMRKLEITGRREKNPDRRAKRKVKGRRKGTRRARARACARRVQNDHADARENARDVESPVAFEICRRAKTRFAVRSGGRHDRGGRVSSPTTATAPECVRRMTRTLRSRRRCVPA